jgi:hypothetical protein
MGSGAAAIDDIKPSKECGGDEQQAGMLRSKELPTVHGSC